MGDISLLGNMDLWCSLLSLHPVSGQHGPGKYKTMASDLLNHYDLVLAQQTRNPLRCGTGETVVEVLEV